MSIILKDPKSLEDDVIRLLAGFSQMHLPSLMDELNRWHPPVDVFETEDKLIILAEIAGISVDKISIKQIENTIIISGNRDEILPEPSPMFHHMEINYGPFERVIRLPVKFVGGEVSAKYRNGFLRVEIKENKTVSRTIEIK